MVSLHVINAFQAPRQTYYIILLCLVRSFPFFTRCTLIRVPILSRVPADDGRDRLISIFGFCFCFCFGELCVCGARAFCCSRIFSVPSKASYATEMFKQLTRAAAVGKRTKSIIIYGHTPSASFQTVVSVQLCCARFKIMRWRIHRIVSSCKHEKGDSEQGASWWHCKILRRFLKSSSVEGSKHSLHQSKSLN